MNKKIFIFSSLLLSEMTLAQVGINTTDPKATFDVVASATDVTKTDGIIAPRLTGNQLKAKDGLYSLSQTGSIVYVTAAAVPTTEKTVNVTSVGYYYFDGDFWVKLKIGSESDAWLLTGNIATTSDFVGTLNDVPLNFKIHNEHAGQISKISSSYGYFALSVNTTGVYNSAFGFQALQGNTTGNQNSAFGNGSLKSNTTGYGNQAFGEAALGANTSGELNNAFGYKALASNVTSNYNNAFGNSALENTIGGRNSAFGQYTLQQNTTGHGNSAFGDGALAYNNIGSYNTAMGTGSLSYSTGSYNTAIGYLAGSVGSELNLSTINNTTAIGNNAKVSASNSMVLGATNSVDEVNVGINITAPKAKLHIVKNASQLTPAIIQGCNEYLDNSAAISAGLPEGALYRTGDILKIVH